MLYLLVTSDFLQVSNVVLDNLLGISNRNLCFHFLLSMIRIYFISIYSPVLFAYVSYTESEYVISKHYQTQDLNSKLPGNQLTLPLGHAFFIYWGGGDNPVLSFWNLKPILR